MKVRQIIEAKNEFHLLFALDARQLDRPHFASTRQIPIDRTAFSAWIGSGRRDPASAPKKFRQRQKSNLLSGRVAPRPNWTYPKLPN